MDSSTSSHPFSNYTDLAAERLGGKALLCSDDFFAGMENLLKPGRGIFIADKYTDRGKWMDGWESRRKRVPGHDWCIIRLGASGIIHGVDIDTNHFLGNHPPHASLDACYVPHDTECTAESFSGWKTILPRVDLKPGSQHFFEIADRGHFSHLRLNIYPDGGVARLKVYGEVVKDWQTIGQDELVDLAAAVNGARSVLCNDMFFSHMDNLIMPGRGVNMGDGWETKRNRTPGNRDWVIVRLAHKGCVHDLCVDTCHFKGNYPDTCLLEGCLAQGDTDFTKDLVAWQPILPQTKLSADAEHFYNAELLNKDKEFSHIRLTIFPDGGISRLRVNGCIRK
jgi:allantoicase